MIWTHGISGESAMGEAMCMLLIISLQTIDPTTKNMNNWLCGIICVVLPESMVNINKWHRNASHVTIVQQHVQYGSNNQVWNERHCPASRTTLVATRFRVAVICPIIQVLHCIRVFFYFVWFVFINHIFQFYYELCTYCNILDIYLS